MEVGNMIRSMGVSIDLKDITNELKHITDFIYRADTMAVVDNQNTEGGIKKKVEHLMKAVFVMEDTLEKYLNFEEQELHHRTGCAALFCEIVDSIKGMILRHQLKCIYEDLKSQFHEIEITKAYGGQNIISTSEQGSLSESEIIEGDAQMNSACIPVNYFFRKRTDIINKPTMQMTSSSEQEPSACHLSLGMPVSLNSQFCEIIEEDDLLSECLPVCISTEEQVQLEQGSLSSSNIVVCMSTAEQVQGPLCEFLPVDLNSQFHEIIEDDKKIAIPSSQVVQGSLYECISTSEQGSQFGEIKDIDLKIQSSLERGSRSSGNQNVNLQKQYLDRADVVVGFETQIHKLIGWLVNEETPCTVISVIGLAGTGKTTLAKEIFHDQRMIDHFDCSVWITVSSSYTVEELLRGMLHLFYKQSGGSPPHGIFAMDRALLIDELSKYLQEKTYAVFFDDVCDENFWHEIGLALIDNRKGSRIFITTRRMNVSENSKMFYSLVKVHEMEPLTPENSLKLFTMRAIQSELKANYHEDLEDLSYEIASKCKGLPLALTTIAGSLLGKPKTKWKRFSQNLSSELETNPDLHGITDIFSLSYDDLPSHLKQCLLYFAIYPEDYEVKSKRLIQQWIAEGFVKQEPERTLDEVAEEYLSELVNRNLVQVSSVSLTGKVKGCWVHDLLREMILRKADQLGFCKFIRKDVKYLSSGIVRHLSIATSSNDLIESVDSSHVQSLHFFTEEELPKYFVKKIPTKYKKLKVLDFESATSLDVPENFGDLIYLKYLSFRYTDIQSIPKSIGELQNLETLDLRQTAANEIPKEIKKLIKLKHLLCTKMSSIQLTGCIGGMESLQTLSEVRIDEDRIELITELGKLTQLRKLHLSDVREKQGNALSSSINEMQHLEKLYIETKSKDVAIDFCFISCPPFLQKLRLKAKLNKLPLWIPTSKHLVELSLSYSQLTEDPLESLQNLPNLLVLNLAVHSYEGDCLHFQNGGFMKLKELGIRYLYNLETIIIDYGALLSLKELTFMNIPRLKMAPNDISRLVGLEVLNAHFMPTEFEKSIAPLAKHVKETRA